MALSSDSPWVGNLQDRRRRQDRALGERIREGMRLDPRRRMFRERRGAAASAGLAAGFLGLLALGPAMAEEPLFLRIRPQGASPAEIGAGGASEAEAEAARRARAAREAVWERSNARARIVIASVCTGCMKPLPPAPKAAHEAAETPAAGPLAALEPREPNDVRDDSQTRAPRAEGAPDDKPDPRLSR